MSSSLSAMAEAVEICASSPIIGALWLCRSFGVFLRYFFSAHYAILSFAYLWTYTPINTNVLVAILIGQITHETRIYGQLYLC